MQSNLISSSHLHQIDINGELEATVKNKKTTSEEKAGPINDGRPGIPQFEELEEEVTEIHLNLITCIIIYTEAKEYLTGANIHAKHQTFDRYFC